MPSPTEANVESLIQQQANLLQTVIKVEEETTTTTTTNNDEKMVVTKMEVTSDEPLSWLKDEPIGAVTTSAMPELTGDIEEDDDEDIAPVGRTISEDEGDDAKDDKPRRKVSYELSLSNTWSGDTRRKANIHFLKPRILTDLLPSRSPLAFSLLFPANLLVVRDFRR